jgi:hypothetical protein
MNEDDTLRGFEDIDEGTEEIRRNQFTEQQGNKIGQIKFSAP